MTKILVVEDNSEYRGHLCDSVRGENTEVLEASSDEEARAILLREARNIGVAIVDLKLPSDPGIGVELIRTISDSYPQIVSIALTGMGETYLERCMEAGGFSFLQKEKANPADILATVRRALDRHTQKKAHGPELKERLTKIAGLFRDASQLLDDLVSDM